VIPGRLSATTQVMEARAAFEFSTPAAATDTSDATRFEAIYRRHFASIDAYARRRLPTRADDVVAETFLVVWRRLEHVPDDELPWLYGVARRVVADLRRSADRQEAVTKRLAAVRNNHPDQEEADTRLSSALARLPEADRELLFLVYWEELEPRRAADALGCSRATVATRLWRAHRRLRNELARLEGEVR
jgi:RNA polymerase sigma-70 factor, ECF subfamily